MQGFQYFTKLAHYIEVAMRITVVVFLLSDSDESVQIGAGSFAVLYSWITLIQYLKLVPIMGIYIIVVQTIFWTLMKVCHVNKPRCEKEGDSRGNFPQNLT